MKSKTKMLVVLIILVSTFPLLSNNKFKSDTEDINKPLFLKSSAGYIESFIHIDGSIANNWSDTLAEPWCNLINGFYVIENVTIDATASPTGSGIMINNSKNVKFIIRNCTIFNAEYNFFDSGIWLENTNNGTIIGNNCSNNHQGIYLINGDVNGIEENTVNDNMYNGIYLDEDSDLNNITGNTVFGNSYGIQLVSDCDSNNIRLNEVNNNDDYGIFFNSFGGTCDNNLILNNTANDNNDYGIYIRYTNYENSVVNNTANNNLRTGIYVQDCNEINVQDNKAYNNERGMVIQNCVDSNFTYNSVNRNLEIGIYLYYNSDDNRVKNNTINQNDLGIGLYQSDFNNITGNTVLDNNLCIFEIECQGNRIENNDCSVPTVDVPIFIDGAATGVGAHNWTWAAQQSWFGGGSGTEQAPYIIENLEISGFGIYNLNGIEIINSNEYFTIRGCKIYNSRAGIFLQRVNNSLLTDNNCSNNNYGGIALEEECHNNDITENTCQYNDEGIYLYLNCTNNRITNNLLDRNYIGISLNEDSNSTLVSGNSVQNNTGSGIYLYYSGYNTITDNIASGNGNDGIYLEEECDNNEISDNIFNENNIGISLYYSDHNSITDNYASFNDYNGIEIEVGNYNSIIRNTFANNSEYGIYIETDSNGNSIYRNYFLANGNHAYDDGTNNNWNSTKIGNYWDNHTGPDKNKDGIVDTPYIYIGGSAGSIDYLPIAPRPPGGLDPVIIAIIITVSIIGGIAVGVVILMILNKQGKISLEKLKKFSFKREKS
jgi:parallel beta-helix repeat protein